MARIKKQNNGMYRVVIRKKGLPTKSATLPTMKEAKHWAIQTEADLLRQRHFGKSHNWSLNQLIDQYIEKEAKHRLSYHSLYDIERRLDTWKSLCGDTLLADLRPATIADARTTLSQHYAPGTVNLLFGTLSTALSYAVACEYIPNNPCKSVRRLPMPQRRDNVLSPEQESIILSNLRNMSLDTALAVEFALATGARRGEITKLRYSHINIAESSVTFYGTKNGKDRTIPISAKWLEFFIRKGEHFRFKINPHYWKNACAEAGIREFRFHDLRHTFVTRAIANGHNPMAVAAFVGHTYATMTQYYCHLKPNDLRAISG